jgi:hypothetical protein
LLESGDVRLAGAAKRFDSACVVAAVEKKKEQESASIVTCLRPRKFGENNQQGRGSAMAHEQAKQTKTP